VTIDEAVMVAGCLAALGGPGHEQTLDALRAVTVLVGSPGRQ
jgi:hypothetical protein